MGRIRQSLLLSSSLNHHFVLKAILLANFGEAVQKNFFVSFFCPITGAGIVKDSKSWILEKLGTGLASTGIF